MRTTVVATALAIGLVVAACGDDGADDLDGRRFLSVDVEGRTLVDGTRIELRFDDSNLSASAGCNSIVGGYELDADVLVTEQLAITEMGCEPALMDQDGWIAELLASRPSLVLDGNRLRVEGLDVAVELLDAAVADPDRSLEQTTWTVDGLIDGDAVSSVPGDVEASILLDAGDVAVSTGCNGGSGSYELSEDRSTITFGPIATSLRACVGAAGDVEAHVLAVLTGTATVDVDAARLTLRQTDGDLGLTFVAGG